MKNEKETMLIIIYCIIAAAYLLALAAWLKMQYEDRLVD